MTQMIARKLKSASEITTRRARTITILHFQKGIFASVAPITRYQDHETVCFCLPCTFPDRCLSFHPVPTTSPFGDCSTASRAAKSRDLQDRRPSLDQGTGQCEGPVERTRRGGQIPVYSVSSCRLTFSSAKRPATPNNTPITDSSLDTEPSVAVAVLLCQGNEQGVRSAVPSA
jgi:hypothetical protein